MEIVNDMIRYGANFNTADSLGELPLEYSQSISINHSVTYLSI